MLRRRRAGRQERLVVRAGGCAAGGVEARREGAGRGMCAGGGWTQQTKSPQPPD